MVMYDDAGSVSSHHTHLNPADFLDDTGDCDIDQAIRNLRVETGKDWRIKVRSYCTTKWPFGLFKKAVTLFTLYYHVDGHRFHVKRLYESYNDRHVVEVTKTMLMNWIEGYLEGLAIGHAECSASVVGLSTSMEAVHKSTRGLDEKIARPVNERRARKPKPRSKPKT